MEGVQAVRDQSSAPVPQSQTLRTPDRSGSHVAAAVTAWRPSDVTKANQASATSPGNTRRVSPVRMSHTSKWPPGPAETTVWAHGATPNDLDCPVNSLSFAP